MASTSAPCGFAGLRDPAPPRDRRGSRPADPAQARWSTAPRRWVRRRGEAAPRTMCPDRDGSRPRQPRHGRGPARTRAPAHARSLGSADACARGAPEAVEDSREMLARDADAGVGDVEHCLAVPHDETHDHSTAGIRVAQRVRQQVVEHLGEPLGIPCHARRREGVRQRYRARAERLRVPRHAVAHEVVEGDRALVDEQRRALRLSEKVYVVDQPA